MVRWQLLLQKLRRRMGTLSPGNSDWKLELVEQDQMLWGEREWENQMLRGRRGNAVLAPAQKGGQMLWPGKGTCGLG